MDPSLRPWLRAGGLEVREGRAFPAANQPVVRERRAVRAVAAVAGNEAVCLFHPGKIAEQACEQCGAFLCGLCALPIGGQILCPTCLVQGKEQRTTAALADRRPYWGQRLLVMMALSYLLCAAVLPVVSLVVLALAWKHWDSPSSLVHPGKSRFITAVVLAIIGLPLGFFIWWMYGGWWFNEVLSP